MVIWPGESARESFEIVNELSSSPDIIIRVDAFE